MTSSGLEVYDFNEEDELPDAATGKFPANFKNPNSEDNAILKYEFIERVAQDTSVKRDIVRNSLCVDEEAVDCDKKHGNAIPSTPVCTTGDDFANSVENPRLDAAPQSSSTSHEQQVKLDNQESLSLFAESETRMSSLRSPSPRKHLINAHPDSPLKVEPVEMFADADECGGESTTSSPSDIGEAGVSPNGWASDHCFGDLEMDERNMIVMLQPDYVIYQDTYSTESLVTFSQSYIRVVGHGNRETFNFEWGIDDIVDIKCQWFQEVDAILIKLHILSKDAVQTDNGHDTAAKLNPGMEELKIAIVEPNWAEKQTRISCLNGKYLAIWDVVADEYLDGDDLPERSYFPRFDVPFDEVVYPKGDVDAVSISKRDVDLLQPETFINDTIIDFYIKYLKNRIQSEERTRYHFFNSFFFRKLADLDKDPSSASDGRAAFLRVHKWTRKVDLFKKDYIFIPVNFNLHWSLIIICHPGEVATFKDEDLDHLPKVPCILHMDSIKGSHSGLKSLVQSYLLEEWKERQLEMSEQISSKFLKLRFVELELPQQENSFDCGLFLLHYLELFLAEAPTRFSPFQIDNFSAFLNVDWFPPVEASLKRALIQKLIFELLENRSRETFSAPCSEKRHSFTFPENNRKETSVEFISKRCSPGLSAHQNLLDSQEGDGIELTLLAASSMRSSQCLNSSGPVLRDLFESATAEGSSLEQYQSYQGSSFYHLKGGITPIEEKDGETGEDSVLLASEQTGFGLASQGCSMSHTLKGFKADTTWDPVISGQPTHDDFNSLSEASDCESDDDIGIIEHFPTGKGVDPSQEEDKDGQKSPSVENHEDVMDNLAPSSSVEGFQDFDKIDGNNKDHLPSKDSASIHIEETTLQCAIESSQGLDNFHAKVEDQVLSSEVANTPFAEGSPLEKILLKDEQHLPSEDPACSEMVKMSTVCQDLDNKILTDIEHEDHLSPKENPHVTLLNSDLVESELEDEHAMPENGDDVVSLHRQQSVKRSDVPELQGQQPVKKLRLTPDDDEAPVNLPDELHL